MRLLLLLVYLPYSFAQQPYGISQLDNYSRLINSGNLAGLGPLQAAVQNGQVRSWSDVDGSSRLSGLPPLPPTQDQVNRHFLPEPLPALADLGVRPTARPTRPTPLPQLIMGPYGVNPTAELPPVPEDKLKGYYDNDGNFVPWGRKTGNKIQGTRIHRPVRKTKAKIAKRRDESIEDYMNEVEDSDRNLRSKKPELGPKLKTTITRVDTKKASPSFNPTGALFSPQHSTKIRPNRHENKKRSPKGRRSQGKKPRSNTLNDSLGHQARHRLAQINQRVPRTNEMQLIPVERPQPIQVVPTTAVPTVSTTTTTRPPIVVTFPPFVYRPKTKEFGRDPYFDNILQEVEEYDDFLDQEAQYRETYPYARLPMNPYLQLHPGQLLPPLFQRGVTIDNSGYVKPLENHEIIGTFDGKSAVQQSVQQPQQQLFQQIPLSANQNSLFPQQTQQQQPFGGLNLFQQPAQLPSQLTNTATATENPLLNIFKLFEFAPIDEKYLDRTFGKR